MAYTEIPASSGGGSSAVAWRATMFSYLRGKLGSTLAADAFIEFDRGNGATLDYAVGGANGTGTQDQSSRGGVLTAQTGAGVGQAYIAPFGAPTHVATPKTDIWGVGTRLSIAAAVDANSNYMLARLGAIAFGATIEIGVVGATSTTTLSFKLYDGTLVVIPTTTAIPATSTFVDVALMFDTTKIFASIGQLMTTGMVDVAETVTDLTHMFNTASNCQLGCETANATNRAVKADKMMTAFQLP